MYLRCPVGCVSLFKRGWWGAVLPGQVPKLTVQVGLVQGCRVVFSIKSNSLSFITREIFCTLGAQKKVAEQLSSTLLNSH
jgi:hypothetical protein